MTAGGVITSDRKEPKLRAEGMVGSNLNTTHSVIARRAKPDEAIAVYSLKWGKFEGGLSTPSN